MKKLKEEKLHKDIAISHCSLENQKITEFISGNLELSDKYLRYKISFYADSPQTEDDKLEWLNEYQDLDFTLLKERISQITKEFINVSEVWKIQIESYGCSDIRIFFITEKEAISFRDDLIKWWLND